MGGVGQVAVDVSTPLFLFDTVGRRGEGKLVEGQWGVMWRDVDESCCVVIYGWTGEEPEMKRNEAQKGHRGLSARAPALHVQSDSEFFRY